MERTGVRPPQIHSLSEIAFGGRETQRNTDPQTIDHLARYISDKTQESNDASPEDKTLAKRLLESLPLIAITSLLVAGVLSNGGVQEILNRIVTR